MIIEETCPICGETLERIVITTYPPYEQVSCRNCGFTKEEKSNMIRVKYSDGVSSAVSKILAKDSEEIRNNKNITSILTDVLSEHFSIPCDLCHKYIEHGDGGCPECVEKCNGKEHWKILLNKILG